MPSLAEDLEYRGLVHQVTDPVLLNRLDKGEVTAYAGFDPSGPSLQLGNLVQLCTLRRLQMAGNRPIVLAGGATGLIGDPGGKSAERPHLSEEDVAGYLEGIRPQLEQFLDFSNKGSGRAAILLDNSSWLGRMSMLDFLRDVGKYFTVNQMVAKESVRSRIERPEQGISYTEFTYMLLQAYDFLHLYREHGCQLQIGGSDQWGNITMGVELIGKICQGEAYGLTSPLVTKADGSKFGKTEQGTIFLDPKRTSPYRMYQFLLNTEDSVVGTLLRFYTFLSHEELDHLTEETAQRPKDRAAQRELARQVCALVHGESEAERAERASRALFGEEISSLDEQTLLDVFEDAPSSVVSRQAIDDGLSLVEALVSSGMARSRSEALRAIGQGGVYVNNGRVTDPERILDKGELLHDRYVVLRKGRRDYHLLRVA